MPVLSDNTADSRLSLVERTSSGWSAYDAVRVVLGLVLLIAAGLKAHQLSTEPTLETGLLNSRWFLIAVVELELLFGLWLLAGLYPKQTRYAALIFFAALAGISLSKALSGAATCGCFGAVEVNPWYTFALNAAAIFAFSFATPCIASVNIRASLARFAFVGVCALACVVLSVSMFGYATATLADDGTIIGDSNTVVLKPDRWVGKRFPLLGHIDIGDALRSGKWIVFFHRPGCPKCEAALEWLQEAVSATADRRLAVVDLDSIGIVENGTYGGYATRALLSPERDWVVQTPLQVGLSDAVVTSVLTTQ